MSRPERYEAGDLQRLTSRRRTVWALPSMGFGGLSYRIIGGEAELRLLLGDILRALGRAECPHCGEHLVDA